MQSKATTVADYLAGLPEDRRGAINAIREVILKNKDANIEEGMQYGMIGYYVPHRVFPDGYHCDPKQPLPYAALASQKNHMAVYLMSVYGHPPTRDWFMSAWKSAGKKLDMGQSCVRFKKLEDVAIEVLGEAIRRIPSDAYIDVYTQAIRPAGKSTASKPASKKATKPAAKAGARPTAKSAAKRTPQKSAPKKAAKRPAAKKK